MKFNGDAKRIKAKTSPEEKPDGSNPDLFSDEPVQTPWEKEAMEHNKVPENSGDESPETEPDDEEAAHKKNVRTGIIIGVVIAALLFAAFIYHNQSGKIRNADISTTSTSTTSVKYGSLDGNDTGAKTYRTDQLTVRRDENGVWRSYAGLEKTVGYTGVVGNDTGWWYVENDVVNFDFTGIADNDYGSWFVVKGKVQTDYSGKVVYKNQMYRVEKGKVTAIEPLTNKATTSTTSTTATTKAPETTVAPSGTTTTTAKGHEHHWIVIYDGDAYTQDGINSGSAVKCPDCGLLFENILLLESHVYTTEGHHELPVDSTFGGLDSKYVLSKDEVGNSPVIYGYTNGTVKYRCVECNAETTNIDDTDLILD